MCLRSVTICALVHNNMQNGTPFKRTPYAQTSIDTVLAMPGNQHPSFLYLIRPCYFCYFLLVFLSWTTQTMEQLIEAVYFHCVIKSVDIGLGSSAILESMVRRDNFFVGLMLMVLDIYLAKLVEKIHPVKNYLN